MEQGLGSDLTRHGAHAYHTGGKRGQRQLVNCSRPWRYFATYDSDLQEAAWSRSSSVGHVFIEIPKTLGAAGRGSSCIESSLGKCRR